MTAPRVELPVVHFLPTFAEPFARLEFAPLVWHSPCGAKAYGDKCAVNPDRVTCPACREWLDMEST